MAWVGYLWSRVLRQSKFPTVWRPIALTALGAGVADRISRLGWMATRCKGVAVWVLYPSPTSSQDRTEKKQPISLLSLSNRLTQFMVTAFSTTVAQGARHHGVVTHPYFGSTGSYKPQS